MYEPSSDWTEKERAFVVVSIAEELENKIGDKQVISQNEMLDYALRIRYILTMPKTFLENNRQQIIEGSTQNPSKEIRG